MPHDFAFSWNSGSLELLNHCPTANSIALAGWKRHQRDYAYATSKAVQAASAGCSTYLRQDCILLLVYRDDTSRYTQEITQTPRTYALQDV